MLEPEQPGGGTLKQPNQPQKDEKPGFGDQSAPDQEGLDPKNIPAKE